jgi:hypothetical protein
LADRARYAVENLQRQVAMASARAGYKHTGSIKAETSFLQWCEELAAAGLKVDRKPWSLKDRPALIPLYEAIPTTREEAQDWALVVQKATQLGLTVWEVLADLYMAKKWGPVNIGMFLPDQATAGFKSEHRFMPILRSSPPLYRELTHRTDVGGDTIKIGEGNVLTRQFAESLLMFLWTSGRVSTESRPMDVVSLDEVQEMSLAQIDKVMARVGDSTIRFKLLLSTANMPELDINHWYLLGSQEVWHTVCEACGEYSDLSDPAGIFPDKSIAYNTGQVPVPPGCDEMPPADDYVWTCPHCSTWIRDAQQGRYISQSPGNQSKIRSFMLPRTISPRITPRAMYEQWARSKTGDQKKSFYNRVLARPYIDANQLPVTLPMCLAAAAEGVRRGLVWETSGRGYYMGIDQMGGFNAVIIKKRLPDGRQAVVHVEAVFNDNPFERCAEMMDQYGIEVCVVEQLPNINDARRFVNRFPRRAFMVHRYADTGDMLVWGDVITKSDKKTSEEDRSRFQVTVHQYAAMQTALYRIRDVGCLFPDPNLLEQDVIEDGITKRIPICRDWVFDHFTKTALVVETDPDTRKMRSKVLKVGLDPHFSFANMLCDVAWSRSHGTGIMILPNPKEEGSARGQADRDRAVELKMPGLPSGVVQMIDATSPGSCGRCSAFKDGFCEERGLNVGAADAGCPLFEARPY